VRPSLVNALVPNGATGVVGVLAGGISLIETSRNVLILRGRPSSRMVSSSGFMSVTGVPSDVVTMKSMVGAGGAGAGCVRSHSAPITVGVTRSA
jgi:hypothetical protein